MVGKAVRIAKAATVGRAAKAATVGRAAKAGRAGKAVKAVKRLTDGLYVGTRLLHNGGLLLLKNRDVILAIRIPQIKKPRFLKKIKRNRERIPVMKNLLIRTVRRRPKNNLKNNANKRFQQRKAVVRLKRVAKTKVR